MAKRRGMLPRGMVLAAIATGAYLLSPLGALPTVSSISADDSMGVLVVDSHTATATTTTQERAPRAITLETRHSKVRAGARAALTGRLNSPEPACVQNEFVKVKRRFFGSNAFRYIVSGLTDFKGTYRFDVKIHRNATYVAITTGTESCRRAESTPRVVLAKVRVDARASDNPVPQGTYFRIAASVRPAHPRTTILLQQRKGSGFVTVSRDELGGKSRVEFIVVAGWGGTREFRVVWPKQDRDHAAGISRTLRITTE